MQYAKRMDGTKSFTICGDPLYFAPEITSNQGYDFAADLWAYGILVYELFEGDTIFDTKEENETNLFKAISEFRYVSVSVSVCLFACIRIECIV